MARLLVSSCISPTASSFVVHVFSQEVSLPDAFWSSGSCSSWDLSWLQTTWWQWQPTRPATNLPPMIIRNIGAPLAASLPKLSSSWTLRLSLGSNTSASGLDSRMVGLQSCLSITWLLLPSIGWKLRGPLGIAVEVVHYPLTFFSLFSHMFARICMYIHYGFKTKWCFSMIMVSSPKWYTPTQSHSTSWKLPGALWQTTLT